MRLFSSFFSFHLFWSPSKNPHHAIYNRNNETSELPLARRPTSPPACQPWCSLSRLHGAHSHNHISLPAAHLQQPLGPKSGSKIRQHLQGSSPYYYLQPKEKKCPSSSWEHKPQGRDTLLPEDDFWHTDSIKGHKLVRVILQSLASPGSYKPRASPFRVQ